MNKKKILSANFIYNDINKFINIKNYKCNTRFSPEANFYLHLGHIKNIIINYDISKIYNGKFKIRIDDTNPKKNEKIFIKYIKKNTLWILNNLNNKKKYKLYYASLYFNKLYQYLEYYKKYKFIKEIKLIRKIKSGYYKEKSKIIKLNKITQLIVYRIKYIKHINTMYNWFIYPLYDWAHTLSDKIENIKYSICSIEFSKNKNLYNFINNIIYNNILPKQVEYSRLIIKNNILKKRLLHYILKNKFIKTKNDLRLLTINSLKNQNITPNIIYNFIKELNLSRKYTIITNNYLIKYLTKNINFVKIINIINKYIYIKIKNFSYLLNFKINNYNYILSNKILINLNIFIFNIFKIYLLKNFKTLIFLKNLNNIICNNYKKNNKGEIIKLYCKYKKKTIYNKFRYNWWNKNYKTKIIIYKKKNILNKNYKLNLKSLNTTIFYTENLIINNILKFYQLETKHILCYKNFYKNQKFNKINFILLI